MIKRASSRFSEIPAANAVDTERFSTASSIQTEGQISLVRRFNKAETATIHRFSKLFDATPTPEGRFDLDSSGVTIYVITTARLSDAVQEICKRAGKIYVALTNRDGVDYALGAITEPRVGIMDPYGKIVRESA